MASTGTEDISETPVLFRAGRKRKAYRHRTEDADSPSLDAGVTDATSSTEAPTAHDDAADPGASQQHHAARVKKESDGDDPTQPPIDAADENESGLSVAQALRLRNARKLKFGGVAFRPESDGSRRQENDGAENMERQMVLADGTGDNKAPTKSSVETLVGGITKRFAPQTGIVGELVNKHMEEYIESELARRKRTAAELLAQQGTNGPPGAASLAARPDLAPSMAVGKTAAPAPAMQGRLQEIDLGDEARARNEVITERAMRRLHGDAGLEDDESSHPKKVRLGRDGKPWRPRNRRGSDDVKRDQLIDSFMRENKLDVYDLKPQQAVDLDGEDEEEGAADDRLAEQFRREFMENQSQRRKKPKTTTAPAKAAKPTEDILRGPKLGGSRNVRQQMRDILLQQQEKRR